MIPNLCPSQSCPNHSVTKAPLQGRGTAHATSMHVTPHAPHCVMEALLIMCQNTSDYVHLYDAAASPCEVHRADLQASLTAPESDASSTPCTTLRPPSCCHHTVLQTAIASAACQLIEPKLVYMWLPYTPAACSLAMSVWIFASLSFTSCSSLRTLVSRIFNTTHADTCRHMRMMSSQCSMRHSQGISRSKQGQRLHHQSTAHTELWHILEQLEGLQINLCS